MEDTSLDQFVDATDEPDGEGPDETAANGTAGDEMAGDSTAEGETATDETAGDAEDSGPSAVPVAPGDVEPAVSTAAWTTDGGECGTCGSTTRRRWRENGTLVCVDCKDW